MATPVTTIYIDDSGLTAATTLSCMPQNAENGQPLPCTVTVKQPPSSSSGSSKEPGNSDAPKTTASEPRTTTVPYSGTTSITGPVTVTRTDVNGNPTGVDVQTPPTTSAFSTAAITESSPSATSTGLPNSDYTCPDGQTGTAADSTYQFRCNATFSGRSTSRRKKRQEDSYSISSCHDKCNADSGCVGANVDGNGECQLLSSIDSYSVGNGSTALYFQSRNGNASITSVELGNSTSSAAGTSHDNKTGAIAGAAVGCFIGGAIIAGLLTWLWCRRRYRKTRSNAYMNEKAGRARPWEAYLPQSADDQTVSRSVQTLLSQIDQHIENYYGNNASGHMTEEIQDRLARLDTGELPKSVDAMMLDTEAPLPVIKHTFAWTIVSRLSPSGTGEGSLLPAEFAKLPPSLASMEGRNKAGARAREEYSSPEAYNYWKVLTAHLMYPRSSNGTSRMPGTVANARECAIALSTAFAPWSKNVVGAEEHLKSILKSASELGLLVMSQPSAFVFDWDTSVKERSKSEVVVLPAFEKVADEAGNNLPHRQVLVRATTEPIMM